MQFVVSLGSSATGLGVGTHTGSVILEDRNTGATVQTIDVQLLVQSTSSTGFTDFPPSTDTRQVFVSSSGNDSNNGLSAQSPKRTIAAAVGLLRNGYPDQLLFKRGETFNDSFGNFHKSGRSATEKMVIGTYGQGARPRIQTGNQKFFESAGDNLEHLAIAGLEITANTYDGTNGDPTAIFFYRHAADILLEDLDIHNWNFGIATQGEGWNDSITNFTVRRCVIAECYCVGSSGRPQGVLSNFTDGYTLEDCYLLNCGYNPNVSGSIKNIYRHATDFDNDTRNTTIRDCVIAETSAHGIHLRGSGLDVQDNLVFHAPIAMVFGTGDNPQYTIGGATGQFINNVVMEGTDIDSSHPRGMGHRGEQRRLRADPRQHLRPQPRQPLPEPAVLHPCRGQRHRRAQPDDPRQHRLRLGRQVDVLAFFDLGVERHAGQDNDFQNPNPLPGAMSSYAKFIEVDPAYRNHLSASGNHFASPDPENMWFQVGGFGDLQFWRSQIGDTTSSRTQLNYVDPNRTWRTYMDMVEGRARGTSTDQNLFTKWRQQARGTWDDRYTAAQINAYIRAGFVTQ